jgi:hypothetical protein
MAGFLPVHLVERSSVTERIGKQWYGAFPAKGEQAQLDANRHSFTVAIEAMFLTYDEVYGTTARPHHQGSEHLQGLLHESNTAKRTILRQDPKNF